MPCVIAAVAWNNAWVPLYLDWTINWKQYDPSQWTFDGADFTLTNPASPTTTSFTGRTILTPNAGNDLYRTILSYADNNPNNSDAQKIKQAIVGLKDIDVLSQRLSGFGAFLQTLQINQPSFLPTRCQPTACPARAEPCRTRRSCNRTRCSRSCRCRRASSTSATCGWSMRSARCCR